LPQVGQPIIMPLPQPLAIGGIRFVGCPCETDREETVLYTVSHYQVSQASWKVLENEFGPGKSQKLKFKLPERHGIYVWFNLTNMPSMYRTP